MVLQNAGYPGGGRAYSHSVPPVAWKCTPCCTAYPSTTQAEGRRLSAHRAAGGNEVLGTAVTADSLVKRDTLRRAGKGSVVRRLLYNRQTYCPLLSIRDP